MSTNFPTSLDNETVPAGSETLGGSTPPHRQVHENLKDAVQALEAKVGANSSAVATSHDYKLANGVVLKSLVDAKGDLLAGTANDTVARKAAGANDTLLIADSSQADGLRWATPTEVRTALALGTAAQVNTGTSAANVPTITQADARYRQRASTATYAARAMRASTSLTLNSTTWANLDTGLDLALTAAAGDWVEVGMSGLAGTEAVQSALDVVSLVSGTPVKNWSENAVEDNTHYGVVGWSNTVATLQPLIGSMMRPLASGDLSAGTLTIRFRYKTTTAANKTLFATATLPLVVWAINHG